MADGAQGEVVAEEVMTYRGFCEHGKVRALMMDPMTGKHSEGYMDDAFKELHKMRKWAAKIDRVPVEEARKSDMTCNACDAPSLRRVKSVNQKSLAF